MEQISLGELPEYGAKRDAVHVAICPAIADDTLKPGEHVGLTGGYDEEYGEYIVGPSTEPIGIVDPFLEEAIPRRGRFYLLLYPNTVTGMRHHWSHPAFIDERLCVKQEFTKEESEQWLREFAKNSDCPDYSILIAAAAGERVEPVDHYYPEAFRLDSDSLHFSGADAHGEIPPEFWDHVENVTGKKCQVRPTRFSCSC